MSSPSTFATLWQDELKKFLWNDKKSPPLPNGAPLLAIPKTATADLQQQAAKKIGKGQDRKKVYGQLLTSTKKGPARVVEPPDAPDAPMAPVAGRGFGGSGDSGRMAVSLGAPSNPGYVRALPMRTKA